MNYELELQNIKDWIKGLIIIQYRQSKRNRALIDLMCELIFASLLILKIRDYCLSVDKSVGAQLDVVGKWVGLDRYYNGIDLWMHPYHSHPYYTTIQDQTFDEYQGGFSTYNDFADNNGGYLMYRDWQDIRTKVNAMGDEFYRTLIKLRIIRNSIDSTCKNIDDAIWKWSDGKVYTTWSTMELTYHYDKSYRKIMQLASYKETLPSPTGVNIVLEELN